MTLNLDDVARLRAGGMTAPQIAGHLRVPLTEVNAALCKPSVKAAVMEHHADRLRPAASRSAAEIERSIAVLAEVRDSDLARIGERRKAAVDIVKVAIELHKLTVETPHLAALTATLGQESSGRLDAHAEDTVTEPRAPLPVSPGMYADEDEI